MARTFSQKPADVTRRWIVIDAREATLGRVSTEIAKYLIGKYKPTYTPHVDGGDYVIVVNAADVVLTGDKPSQWFSWRYQRRNRRRSSREVSNTHHRSLSSRHVAEEQAAT